MGHRQRDLVIRSPVERVPNHCFQDTKLWPSSLFAAAVRSDTLRLLTTVAQGLWMLDETAAVVAAVDANIVAAAELHQRDSKHCRNLVSWTARQRCHQQEVMGAERASGIWHQPLLGRTRHRRGWDTRRPAEMLLLLLLHPQCQYYSPLFLPRVFLRPSRQCSASTYTSADTNKRQANRRLRCHRRR